MSVLDIDCALVTDILTGFLRDEITKFGFHRGVLGMSGGIDSTLSAFLAARALGPENTLGIIMPYASSSPESEGHARLAAEQLGIETRVIEITPQIDAYFERYPDATRLRRANKMARERMTILYDHSVLETAMVIGTSNKTEALLGYTTLWGDMASAVNPIGDLYKTQVRALSTYLGVPQEIIAKAPTADLWTGQTDEGELGFTYEEADRLLYHMVDLRWSREELANLGFTLDLIDRVLRMVRNSQYKRRIPLIAKISPRSIDRDFRYSRDWGR
ncbi:MAG: NAD+ synthase [Armatimonadia bacterium]